MLSDVEVIDCEVFYVTSVVILEDMEHPFVLNSTIVHKTKQVSNNFSTLFV